MTTQSETGTGKQPDNIAVVGAGVVGLCTALRAQRQGFSVTLIDRDPPGHGASFGNAGYLATELIDPLSTPGVLKSALSMWLRPDGPLALPLAYLPRILPWLARFILSARPSTVARSREALVALNRSAIGSWKECLEDIGESEQLLNSGYLLVWESTKGLAAAQAHARYLKHWDIETELLDNAAVAILEPELASTVSHALHFPQACQVRDPYLLCLKLASAFEARGGTFLQRKINHIKPGDQEVQLVMAGKILKFDRVILCTGAWSKQLLRETGLKVPLEAERGYHVTFTVDHPQLHRPIGSADRRFVMSPLESGLRAVGFTELGGLKLNPIGRRFATLQRHSRALLPNLKNETRKTEEWMGHRPTLTDSLPVIDRHPKYDRLLFAFGNQHLGLTQAAITAELVVDIMGGKTPRLDPAPYRVDRF